MEPNSTPETTNTVVHKEGSVGPVIGTIIILAVILLGGLYFWGNRNDVQNANIEGQTQDELDQINTQSDSDDLNSIQDDLNSTDVNVGSEINAS